MPRWSLSCLRSSEAEAARLLDELDAAGCLSSERDGAAPGEPRLPALRHTLVQAAWAAQRCRRTDPLQRWARAVQRRRGKRVAAVALARKLAGILYALWSLATTCSSWLRA